MVRRRMGKTGESFTTARAQLLGLSGARRPSPRQGERSMYPFDRFTEAAKDVIACAQQEAEASGTGYIGTEHLLLGLLTCSGAAAAALQRMGVEAQPVQEAIEARLGSEERYQAGRVLPARRVKTVIELAFAEAGASHVGTEHLLLGILSEAGGVGARVLAQFGVTVDRAREAVSAVLSQGAPHVTRRAFGSSSGMPSPLGVHRAFEGARQSAAREGAMLLRSDHLLCALVQRDSPVPALPALLAAVGADLDTLRQRLKPPRKITRLEAEIWRL